MDATGYLDSCKEKLGVTSSYALSKVIDISEQRISDYYKGKNVPDEYACFRFAEILEMSPVVVIAEIQAANSKKPDKALFFKHFLTTVGLWIIIAVIPVNLGTFSNNAYAAGSSAEMALIQHISPLYESCKRLLLMHKPRQSKLSPTLVTFNSTCTKFA